MLLGLINETTILYTLLYQIVNRNSSTECIDICYENGELNAMKKKDFTSFSYFSVYLALKRQLALADTVILFVWLSFSRSSSMRERKHELHAGDVSAHRNHSDRPMYNNVAIIEHRFHSVEIYFQHFRYSPHC